MEKRKLNLNAPLLSARRYSSPLKSGELVEREFIEKQPPIWQQSRKSSNGSEWESEAILKPAGGIPFQWELSPGRPKDGIGSPARTPQFCPVSKMDAFRRYHSGEVSRVPLGRTSYYSGEVSRLTPARFSSGERINDHNIYKPQVEAFSFNDHANLVEKLNESLNYEVSGSESGNDTYSDALEMLSPGESGAVNYSMNGNHSSGVKKPSGKSSVDTQTRDLMMNRFLQAAKAAVVETPEYALKKSAAVNRLPKPVKKAVSRGLPPTPKPNNVSCASPYYKQHPSEVESEDDQDCKNTVKKSGKAWGILPRFCVKNTLCLLNPLPGIKSRMQLPTPSTPTAVSGNKFTRNARSGPLDKSGFPLPEPQKKKFYSGLLSRDLLKNENKLATESDQFVNSHDSFFRSGLSPLRRYRSGNPSPCRNELPKYSFSGPQNEVEDSNANKIASSRKLFNALHNVSRNHTYDRGGDAVEKTVYIDKCSYQKKNEVYHDTTPCLKTKKSLKFGTSNGEVQDFSFVVDSKLKGRHAGIFEEGKTVSPKFGFKAKMHDEVKSSRKPDNRKMESMKHFPDEKRDYQKPKAESKKEAGRTTPLGPPLPNSPSESWLWKTLPSIPKPQRSHSQPLQKARSIDAKWEAVPNRGQQHRPYSQELAPRSTH